MKPTEDNAPTVDEDGKLTNDEDFLFSVVEDAPADVQDDESAEDFMTTPTTRFLINYHSIISEFRMSTNFGTSVKGPNLGVLQQEAAKYAALFTQIELQMASQK